MYNIRTFISKNQHPFFPYFHWWLKCWQLEFWQFPLLNWHGTMVRRCKPFTYRLMHLYRQKPGKFKKVSVRWAIILRGGWVLPDETFLSTRECQRCTEKRRHMIPLNTTLNCDILYTHSNKNKFLTHKTPSTPTGNYRKGTNDLPTQVRLHKTWRNILSDKRY